MEKYKLIKYTDIDYINRTAIIQNIVNKKLYTISFIEFNMDEEHFMKDEEFEAKLGITFISEFKKSNIQKLSHTFNNHTVNAIVEISEKIDDYEYSATCSFCDEDIFIKFEKIANLNVGDYVELSGELTIRSDDLDEYIGEM